MEACLPDNKLTSLSHPGSKATKQEILSLVGLLQHATKIIHCGRNLCQLDYRLFLLLRIINRLLLLIDYYIQGI